MILEVGRKRAKDFFEIQDEKDEVQNSLNRKQTIVFVEALYELLSKTSRVDDNTSPTMIHEDSSISRVEVIEKQDHKTRKRQKQIQKREKKWNENKAIELGKM